MLKQQMIVQSYLVQTLVTPLGFLMVTVIYRIITQNVNMMEETVVLHLVCLVLLMIVMNQECPMDHVLLIIV